MGLMLLVGIAWMVLGVAVAVLIGRAIRAADTRAVARADDTSPKYDAQVLTLRLPRDRTLA